MASLVVVLAVVGFFAHAFQRNWASIQAHRFEFQPLYLALSFVAFLATTLLGIYALHDSFNTLSTGKLSFVESVATMSSSSLMKYIPGKVWSYALQMYVLSQRGIRKSLVLYVNLINIAISLLASMLIGCALLLVAQQSQLPHLPRASLWWFFGALVAADLACVQFNATMFGWLIGLANRLFKRNIERFDVPLALLLRLHAVHAAAAITFGLAVCCVCRGIGYQVGAGQALTVAGTFLLADVAGFLAFVSPGGLGVRESVMYALLGGAASGSLAVLVPLAARAVGMVVDILLGGTAIKLLKDLSGTQGSPDSTAP